MLPRLLLILSVSILLSACNIKGSSEKGPFLIGSTVTLSKLNQQGTLVAGSTLTGQVLDSTGQYSISEIEWSGWAQLRVSGQYFDELTGEESQNEMALEAITKKNQRLDTANIHLFSHLAAARIRYKVAEGDSLNKAWRTTQKELKQTFGLQKVNTGINRGIEQLSLQVGYGTYRRDNANLLLFTGAFLAASGDQNTVQLLAQDFADDAQFNGVASSIFSQIATHARKENFIQTLRANLKKRGVSNPPNKRDLGELPDWVNATDGRVDSNPPVITVLGDNPLELTLGATYTELGATALDAEVGPVEVVVTGLVDNNTVGDYSITYTATDTSSNTATATRVVNVVAAPVPEDTTPPVITLSGESEIIVLKGMSYTDAGATATDDRDGTVTVTTTGNVDTSTANLYTLTYSATDAAGNNTTATRTVDVFSCSPGTVPLRDECLADDDNDGLPNLWETQHQLNPADGSDYNNDPDGDGFINVDEFKADTQPNERSSKPSTIYPSTSTSWVITGNFEAPTDAETLQVLPDAEAVKNWELTHADISFGGNFDDRNDEMGSMIGYMYNQKLEFTPGKLEMNLKQRATQDGIDYEDFFLHFSEDTTLEDTFPLHAALTPLNGRATFVGFKKSSADVGRMLTIPYNFGLGVWNYSSDEGLYVFLFEKFDQLDLDLVDLSNSGNLVVEYPSAIDEAGTVTQWSALTITDGTNHLAQDGTITWTPPNDWQWAATYNSGTGDGSDFSQPLLKDGGRYYMVRLRLEGNTGTAGQTRPTLRDVNLKKWITPSVLDSAHKVVPGWDAVNDIDGNGYIDDSEFASRSNTTASARFRHEARAVPVGNMWSKYSSFCRTDLSNTSLRTYLGDFYKQDWAEGHYSGAYNDSFFRMLGSNTFKLVSGGTLQESGLNIGSDQAQADYEVAFAETLGVIRSRTRSAWISANISGVNLYTNPAYLSFVDALDAVLREDYLKTSLGLSGFFGLNKAWDTFALAKEGKKSILMAMNKSGRSLKLDNTQHNWEKDIESGLAQYYLMNVPGKTYYQAWNSSYQYGSGNTVVAGHSFWKEGVPRNYAYQPEKMLQVDIGTPDGVIPEAKQVLKYMTKTKVPKYDYTVIGDSTDTQLQHAEIGRNGVIDVIPSHIYYLDRSVAEVVESGPQEAVLARSYSKGLVLFRTNFFGGSSAFMQTASSMIDLPGNYQRVLFDGTLGPVISSISLTGYEGAVLVKVVE